MKENSKKKHERDARAHIESVRQPS